MKNQQKRKKKLKKTGTKVKLYEGTIPQGGKQVFTFGIHKLCHRSVAKDKSDYLVHIETKAVIMAYPLRTDRSIVLENIAKNIDTLNHFIEHAESYELVSPNEVIKKDVKEPESTYSAYKKPSYSRSGNYSHLNEGSKKKYIIKDLKW